MDQKFTRENRESHIKSKAKRKSYRVCLEELQQYFDYNLFCIEDYDINDDYDEELYRQYREQAIAFLYSIGAMLNIEKFLDVEGNGVVYVRKLPSGITHIKKGL